MKKKDIENLVGESMEDMGLEEHIDERECMNCGYLIEEGNPGMVCWRCEADMIKLYKDKVKGME